MGNILEVRELKKEYDGENVLNGINLLVEEGEFVVIMGRSGSGKSTLLYNISGMDNPSSGNVYLEGQDICNLKDEEMSRVRLTKMGFVFQQSKLLKKLSIKDNILLPGFKAKISDRNEVVRYADELMKQVEIDLVADHDINKVSGGQLQRAAICRALINKPKIIFGDEPTGALNSNSSNEIMKIFKDINQRGTTVVLVTHDAKVAAWADRIIYIADGNIKAELSLSKNEVNDKVKREEAVNAWLLELGF